jgi:hypothetical protein
MTVYSSYSVEQAKRDALTLGLALVSIVRKDFSTGGKEKEFGR